ncbi:MAG: GFA family protein [Methyloligellaceae bacterium]
MRSGRCLCGAVTYTLEEPAEAAAICHCAMCRRWAGGPFFAVHCTQPVVFNGEENITRYRSSDWAERGFCSRCGTSLFYHLIPSGEHIISAFTLDEQSDLRLASQIFIDEKPALYSFADATPVLTGAEVFAQFQRPEGGGA